MKITSETRKPRNYWTIQSCRREALKYETKTEWCRSSSTSYELARKRGWLEQLSRHMREIHKTPGYWTKDRCLQDARRFKSRSEWAKTSGSAYNMALGQKWLEESCRHMVPKMKPSGYWTKERCAEEAHRYQTPSEWQKGNGSSYGIAREKKWLTECCRHMTRRKMPNNYWTKERCKKEAKKFESRTIFSKTHPAAYHAALKYKWIDDICGHMKTKVRYRGYSVEELADTAREFATRRDFRKAYPQMVLWAGRRGILDQICSHMKPLGSRYRRQVYVFENPDRTAYVGLSYSAEARYKQHIFGKRPDAVGRLLRRKKEEFGSRQVFKVLPGYFSQQEARNRERRLLQKYKRDGWLLLNSAKPGSLGGNIHKHTLDSCRKVCLKYTKRSQVDKNHSALYRAVLKNGWQKECFGHMEIIKHDRYSDAYLLSVIAKVISLKDFQKKYKREHRAASKRPKYREWTAHLARERIQHSRETVLANALKCRTRLEFFKRFPGDYAAAKRQGIFEKACSHMKAKPGKSVPK